MAEKTTRNARNVPGTRPRRRTRTQDPRVEKATEVPQPVDPGPGTTSPVGDTSPVTAAAAPLDPPASAPTPAPSGGPAAAPLTPPAPPAPVVRPAPQQRATIPETGVSIGVHASSIGELIVDASTGQPPTDPRTVFKRELSYGTVRVCTVRLNLISFRGPHRHRTEHLLLPQGSKVDAVRADRLVSAMLLQQEALRREQVSASVGG